jgi:hypothetical protein
MWHFSMVHLRFWISDMRNDRVTAGKLRIGKSGGIRSGFHCYHGRLELVEWKGVHWNHWMPTARAECELFHLALLSVSIPRSRISLAVKLWYFYREIQFFILDSQEWLNGIESCVLTSSAVRCCSFSKRPASSELRTLQVLTTTYLPKCIKIQ